jgi:uncharacterized protein (TIGR00369 family)
VIPADPLFEARVRASFARQGFMRTLGAELLRVEPGLVEIAMPFSAALTQQHGFVHAGAVSSILDTACGYAASTLMPAAAGALTVEFKVNLLSPALGERFVALARVVKAGRTITVTQAEVHALQADARKLVATMTGTIMTVYRDGVQA